MPKFGCLEFAAWRAGRFRFASYEERSPDGAVNELLLRRVLYEIYPPELRVRRGSDSRSHRIVELDGVSRIRPGECRETSADARQRDLADEDAGTRASWFGKMFADATKVAALAITITGDKRYLGFVEPSTEKAQVLTSRFSVH